MAQLGSSLSSLPLELIQMVADYVISPTRIEAIKKEFPGIHRWEQILFHAFKVGLRTPFSQVAIDLQELSRLPIIQLVTNPPDDPSYLRSLIQILPKITTPFFRFQYPSGQKSFAIFFFRSDPVSRKENPRMIEFMGDFQHVVTYTFNITKRAPGNHICAIKETHLVSQESPEIRWMKALRLADEFIGTTLTVANWSTLQRWVLSSCLMPVSEESLFRFFRHASDKHACPYKATFCEDA